MSGPAAPQAGEAETAPARRVEAARAAVLIDASNYFPALRSALLQARRSVFIVGWDVDSRTRIRGEAPPDDGMPETLGALLTHLVERRPALEVHVLLWDYSVLYAAEREPLPRLNLDWRTPDRVHVCLDAELPVGASHHEKLVVVDDAVAFCGGLDLTIRRWDTPSHRADETRRTDPAGRPYGPFHDAQMVVDGDAARALGAIARERWARAKGAEAAPAEVSEAPWPDGVEADLTDVGVRIARTRAAFGGRAPLRQVETAYVEAIGRAERRIYIESQYLTAGAVADALRRRLDARPSLEVLIVTSALPSGWLEIHTMGVARERFLAQLGEHLHGPRLRIVSPYVVVGEERVDIKVHAKLMIVDDSRLQIGSSNLNNRSMAVDTECDLLIDAERDAHRETLERLRRRLIAEHLGVAADELGRREADCGSMIAALEGAGAGERGVAPVEPGTLTEDLVTATLTQIADPEKPLDPEAFVGDLFGAREVRPLLRRARRLLIVPAVLLVVLALWRYSPIGEWLSPERLGPAMRSLSASPWGGPAVLAVFVIGSLAVFPVTVMIAATAVAFGPWDGFLWAFAGCLLGAGGNFAVGRWLGRRLLRGPLAERLAPVSRRLRAGGIVHVMILRNLPIAPFGLVNYAAGASAVRTRDYLLGTALGMAPGVAALTVLGDRLRDLWQQPTPTNLGLLAAAVALWFGLALGLQSLSNRFARR